MATDCMKDGFDLRGNRTRYSDSSHYKHKQDYPIVSWQGYSGGILQNGYCKSGKVLGSNVYADDETTVIANKHKEEVVQAKNDRPQTNYTTMRNLNKDFDLHNDYCRATYQFTAPRAELYAPSSPTIYATSTPIKPKSYFGYTPPIPTPNGKVVADTTSTEHCETFDRIDTSCDIVTVVEDFEDLDIKTEYVEEIKVTYLTENVDVEEHLLKSGESERMSEYRCRETILIDNTEKKKPRYKTPNSETPTKRQLNFSSGADNHVNTSFLHLNIASPYQKSKQEIDCIDDYVVIDQDCDSISWKETSKASIFVNMNK